MLSSSQAACDMVNLQKHPACSQYRAKCTVLEQLALGHFQPVLAQALPATYQVP